MDHVRFLFINLLDSTAEGFGCQTQAAFEEHTCFCPSTPLQATGLDFHTQFAGRMTIIPQTQAPCNIVRRNMTLGPVAASHSHTHTHTKLVMMLLLLMC